MRDFLYTITAYILQNISWPFEYFFFKKYLNVKIAGRDNLLQARELARKEGRGILFVSNHASELDQILIAFSLGFLSKTSPLFYVARARKDNAYEKERWGWRAFTYRHWFLRLFGAYPIVPNQKDYSATLYDHKQLLEKRKSLVVFPEGNITRDTVRGTAKGGVGYLIEAAQPVVVPVFIDGLWKMKSQDFWKRNRNVTVTFKDPIHADSFIVDQNFSEETVHKTIAEKTMDSVYKIL